MDNTDIIFFKNFLFKEISDTLFDDIYAQTEWHSVLKNENGEDVKINRAMAYEDYAYSLKEDKTYKYANLTLPSSPLSISVKLIMSHIKLHYPQYEFNSCLLNLYPNGKSEIRWHSDREEQLGPNPVIAMISLGSDRTFHMSHKETREKSSYLLEHGDLFIMLENCQENYLHAVLKEKHITEPRISLTFRSVI
jgi:alkylated DNA repair dioxygenase AlkB